MILWKWEKGCAYPVHIRGGVGDTTDPLPPPKCHGQEMTARDLQGCVFGERTLPVL
jgi:hypothetical protein